MQGAYVIMWRRLIVSEITVQRGNSTLEVIMQHKLISIERKPLIIALVGLIYGLSSGKLIG